MVKINAEKLKRILKNSIVMQDDDSPAAYYNDGLRKAIGELDYLVYKKVNKKRKRTNEPHKITEVCNFCKNAVTLYWDTKHDGYDIYCPCCGKKMKLSDAYYREVTAKEQELK